MRARTLISLFATTLFAGFSFGATTVTTDPVGFVSYSFSQGTRLVGIPLLNAPLFQGRISGTGVNGNVLTIDGSGLNIGELLDGSKSYFIEIVSDPENVDAFEGDRFDIDTAATITSADETITIVPSIDNATNTIAGSPPVELGNCTFVLRQHVTLGDINQLLPNAFQSGDVIVKRRVSSGALTAFTFNGTNWRIGLSIQNSEILHPGTGLMLVRSAAAETTAKHVGHVRNNDFVQPILAGSTLLAEGFPIESAPKPAAVGAASRFFTNDQGTAFAAGDTLVAHSPSSGAITGYTYNAASNQWRIGLSNQNTANLFGGTGCVFLTTQSVDSDYVQLRPY